MRGWFDAFRHDGGPTLYDRANRTAVTGDVPTIAFCGVFITLFVAFLIIFPGIRKERFTTFTSVTLSLFVGAVILVGNSGSEWHTAEVQITSAYKAFSSEKIVAHLGVHIGFNHVNVTLRTVVPLNSSDRIDYNERFKWDHPDDMVDAYSAALHKGLPYPILTVAEYLAWDEEGFGWGRAYRYAGYFSSIALWSSFASWLLMNIFVVVVPRYGAYLMILTGGLMLLTNLLYYIMLPSQPLVIRFEDAFVSFSFGWCYWVVLIGGCLCTFFGLVIALVEVVFPHKFSTILELDYDTPYDRHIIIEESHDTKLKRPRLEEPNETFGSRIFRRLSKRQSTAAGGAAAGGTMNAEDAAKYGLDNPAMELDPPKSPWRYQHRTFSNQAAGGNGQPYQGRPSSRTESRKSTKSVNFREFGGSVYGRTLHPSSAALAPSIEAPGVEITPEESDESTAPAQSDSPSSMRQEVAESVAAVIVSGNWDPDSSSSEDEGEDELERVQDIPLSGAVTVNLHNQFRAALSRTSSAASRSHQMNRQRYSSNPAAGTVVDDWNDPPEMPTASGLPMIGNLIKSALNRSSSSSIHAQGSSAGGAGVSTPNRRISGDEADAIQLDRSGSLYRQQQQRSSALATVSARISAAVEADRSSHRNGAAIDGDEVTRVDLW